MSAKPGQSRKSYISAVFPERGGEISTELAISSLPSELPPAKYEVHHEDSGPNGPLNVRNVRVRLSE